MIVRMFAVRARHKHITLEFECTDMVPQLISDKVRIEQIIVNFVSNAMKFTPVGGKVKLHLAAFPIANRPLSDRKCPRYLEKVKETVGELFTLRVKVSDTGIGISPHLLQTLFTPFSQGESGIARKFGGTGG